MKILANEFVLPMVDGLSCHASHFALLPDGRVFCVFFYGSAEGNDDVRIYGAFREPSGGWSAPFAITEDDGIPHWNPVLFERRDGAYILYYKVGRTIRGWKTYYRISTDNCQTWSAPVEMVPGDNSGGRGSARNKAIYLSDGSILAPGSTEVWEWKCFFDRSTDGGETWSRSEELCITEEIADRYYSLKGRGIIQPTIWESEPGRVHALMRSTEEVLFRSDSEDYGVTWCKPYAIDVPNNNSGVDLDKLDDGRLLLVYNPVGRYKGPRTPVSLAISEDNGRTWKQVSHLVTMPGEYSYPAIRCVGKDAYITYTWNRKTIQYWHLRF